VHGLTIICDTWGVHWSTRLEVCLDLDEFISARIELRANRDGSRSLVLPVLLNHRTLIPASRISDERGQSVHVLTFQEAGPVLESIFLGTAQSVLDSVVHPANTSRSTRRTQAFGSHGISH
jgi:hypothetical protein